MPFSDFTEPAILNSMLGGVVALVNQTIAAGTTAQTSITIEGSAGSGNADHTPVVGEVWAIATPGAAGSENALTNWDVFTVSGLPTATSLTFASRTVVAARAPGDVCFVLTTTTGLSSTFGTHLLEQELFFGLSTAGASTTIASASDLAVLPQSTINVASTTGFATSGNILIQTEQGVQEVAYAGTSSTTFTGCTGGTGTIDTGDVVIPAVTEATILANEPTSTGAYARPSTKNNAAAFAAASGTYPALKQNAAQIAWAASTAAWSSGASPLAITFVSDKSTLAAGNVLFWVINSPAQTVNNSGITVQIAVDILKLQLL